jgi:glyoxalase family protein
MAGATGFSVPEASLDYWLGRFSDFGIDFQGPDRRFDNQVLLLRDPHGLPLELAFLKNSGNPVPWENGVIDAEHAIRGFSHTTLHVSDSEGVANLLATVLGYKRLGQEDTRLRLGTSAGGIGSVVDVVAKHESERSRPGSGTIHHVAFRARSHEHLLKLSKKLVDVGIHPTGVIDRMYFRSIYFRDPVFTGGILFEIATDDPGFFIDEHETELGTSLRLPPQYEPRRTQIESALPLISTRSSGIQ